MVLLFIKQDAKPTPTVVHIPGVYAHRTDLAYASTEPAVRVKGP
jgi:hypothetical protein